MYFFINSHYSKLVVKILYACVLKQMQKISLSCQTFNNTGCAKYRLLYKMSEEADGKSTNTFDVLTIEYIIFKEGALRMLFLLCGSAYKVLTRVAIRSADKKVTFAEKDRSGILAPVWPRNGRISIDCRAL